MPTEKVKFTASVALPLGRFLERYQKEHNLPTRSEALEQAIKLCKNVNSSGSMQKVRSRTTPFWDNALLGGLDNAPVA